ncbi:MAG: DNA polymerase III subunit alpha, partial [Bacteroidota bacterium]
RFVVEKYGEDSVAQIITYGTMGAKTAIRDVGRVLRIPLEDVNRIAKLVPDKPGMNFKKALDKGTNPDTWEELEHAFTDPDPDIAKMMQFARLLEGTPRHTGIHAAGVIIAPGKLTDYAPIAVARSKGEIVTTQYEGPMAEEAGLLKMDFLGLKTLSIIKTAIRLVKEGHDVEIDPDNIPLDDPKTYELYQRGETVATFQFESDGMRKYLKQLKPTVIEDLIAMNALYRPGPMDNIPSFIDRKHGKEQIEYPHPLLEPILNNTYGIMVYQEQIMAAARTLAGYTLGGADLLRRAMGKKKVEVMEKERAKFIKGAAEREIDQKKAEEIFALMEKFAGYGFNKSHAAAYSILAFRTGYLKANYPAEYMAAVLSHNLDNLEKITLFIDECRRMGIDVLSPSVNESQYMFSVNQQGQIRFGLGAIKGVGQSVAEAIIAERDENGAYESIFELTERVDYSFLNKKAFESLCYAGAFDCFETPRPVYFQVEGNNGEARHLLEKAVLYGSRYQEEQNSNQMSIFGGGGGESTTVDRPKIPKQEQQWSLIEQLNHERDVIGFYLSAHPLDRYKHAIAAFARTPLGNLEDYQNRDVSIAAIVTSARERRTRNGNRFGSFTIEDKSGKTEFALFRDDYAKYKSFLEVNECVLIKGKYATPFNGSEYELKITEVRLLEGLVEDQVKRLTLQIPLQVINTGFIDMLDKLLVNHKGKCGVRTQIFDANQQLEIALHLGNRAVHPSAELLTAIEAMNVRCRLN